MTVRAPEQATRSQHVYVPRNLPEEAVGVDHLRLHLSGELHTKSPRTRKRMRRMLMRNLQAALDRHAPGHRVHDTDNPLTLTGPDPDAAARAAAQVFGIHRVSRVHPIPFGSLDELADAVADRARRSVEARVFAVRCRRRGRHPFSSEDVMRAIGARLYPASRGVNLHAPEVEVRVEVDGPVVYLVTQTWAGPSGLPLGAQERSLALLSGGYDSAVAAWMLMRRGSPVHFLHFKLECSASEHALVLAHLIGERWAHGTSPVFWMMDFRPIKDAIVAHVDSRLRQVVLKQLMVAAADRLAARLGIHALITGDAVGQVSSQTLSHLAAIDQYANRSVVRPLAGALKDEIIERARHIGTEDVSARAKEVCDISDGPVAVFARWSRLERAHEQLPADLVDAVLETTTVTAVADWMPGGDPVRVTASAPEGVPMVLPGEPVPERGPVAFSSVRAVHLASRLARAGRQVHLVVHEGEAADGDTPDDGVGLG